MTTLMGRTVKYLALIRAVREIRKEIEKAGLDELKIKANAGISIVGTYLQGCSDQEKKRRKQELNTLLQIGVTPDMILAELSRQMPELAPIMEGKEGYKKSEIQNLEKFLKEG
ncbi:unnamed protein product [marine sediment metagenome]|uniref:Uncharacterized protein n=1 Tax=marine sediment metagenome TaxID=412755 RepID=X1LDV3_9ZZZZ